MERCSVCGAEVQHSVDLGGVGFKPTGRTCTATTCAGTAAAASSSSNSSASGGRGGGERGSVCGGAMLDTVLDWESALVSHEKCMSHISEYISERTPG